mgnify:FL=1
MVKLLMIADDFTGALDTGVQFAKRGISTQIFTKQKLCEKDIKEDTEVLVVDTESRPMTRDDAYRAVYDLACWAVRHGVEIIFKKTDSALRGNIGAELQAVLDAGKSHRLFFFPGYPQIGRITRNGIHYISGELLENSVFGQDPFEPVTKSYLPDIIGEQSDTSVTCITCEEPIPPCKEGEKEIVVCDLIVTEDIDRRLDELLQREKVGLLAGCAALADRLVEKIPFHCQKKKNYDKTKSLYVACGSLNRITQKQVIYAEKKAGFVRRHLSARQKLDPAYYETSEGREFLEEVLELCREKKKVILDTFDEGNEKEIYMKAHGISPEDVRFLIAKAHGKIVQEIVNRKMDVTVLMTGGDTLMGYMKIIGCSQLEPVCEIEPGVAVSILEWNGCRQQVISKSGGFGTEDIMEKIAEKIIR